MEIQKQITSIKEYFEREDIMQKITNYKLKNRRWIKLDFTDLARHDPDLSEDLLDQPHETLKTFTIALEQMDIMPKNTNIRFYNLPHSQRKHVWQIRSEDIGKFIALQGTLNKSSGIMHVCKSARFECPNCGNTLTVLMNGNKFKEPSKCGCGRKGKFRRLDPEIVNNIKLGIVDDLMDKDNIDRSVAREKIAVLMDDLTSELIDRQLKPGKKILLNGYFEYLQKGETTEFESIFRVNYIEFVQVGWDTIEVTPGEQKKIIQLSKQKKIIERLANSIADLEGFEEVKVSALLQLAGAPNMYDGNNHLTNRGTIHVLLISNPGGGKTYFAKRAAAINPIHSFQSATTASGKGLVAAVSNDKDLGGWTIYPGVVVMAHKGVVVIDEIDKTHADDYGDHNNAMNDMEVFLAKASVKARLETETSYLATANPENRVFVPDTLLIQQINMPKDFLDRFDLILPMIPQESKEARESILDVMLDRHLGEGEDKNWSPEFEHGFITKYIAYCRMHMKRPRLNKDLFLKIKEKMELLMKPADEQQTRVSYRQLESILRFAYASARLHLRDITEEDLEYSFNLKKKSFQDLGILDERGRFSWAKLEDIDEKKIDDRESIKRLFDEMHGESGMVEMQRLIEGCQSKGIEEDVVEKWVNDHKKRGDFFEPRQGFIKKI